jgi:hypothetical protein
LFSSVEEFAEPINLAKAAKDLKMAGYTELEILATLEEFKRSGKPYVPGSPPWLPKLPVNLCDAVRDLQVAGYSANEAESFINEFKKTGLPYVVGSPHGISKWASSCNFMTLHAGSTPAKAFLSLCDSLTSLDCKRKNPTTLQDLLINISGGPLKLMQISTEEKRALADQFVKKLSAAVNLHCHSTEANKISKKLAFDLTVVHSPPQLTGPSATILPLQAQPAVFNRFCNRQGILITYRRWKRHGIPVSVHNLRRSPRLSNLADGFKPSHNDNVQKSRKCTPLNVCHSTSFKKSSSKLKKSAAPFEPKACDLAIIPDISPLHYKPAPYLPVGTVRALGTNFCGIPPEELADDALISLMVPNEDVDRRNRSPWSTCLGACQQPFFCCLLFFFIFLCNEPCEGFVFPFYYLLFGSA